MFAKKCILQHSRKVRLSIFPNTWGSRDKMLKQLKLVATLRRSWINLSLFSVEWELFLHDLLHKSINQPHQFQVSDPLFIGQQLHHFF